MNLHKDYKQKTLFDHINQIKTEKSNDYYDNLSESEKKNFNQYLILIGLSMDKECINEISIISKYLNIIPNREFYKVCCDIIPYNKNFNRWIKSKKININDEILKFISKYYEISLSDACDYYHLMANSNNLNEVKNILSKYGLSDKEIKKISSI